MNNFIFDRPKKVFDPPEREHTPPVDVAHYGYAKSYKGYKDFQLKEKYPIIDEMNLWFEGKLTECIYLKDDNNISGFFPKSDFLIEQ